MTPVTLTPQPIGQFTDRECAHLIGGLIGCLYPLTKPEDLKRAVLWWGENWDLATAEMKKMRELLERQQPQKPNGKEGE